MIEFMPESTGQVAGLRASGLLTRADYETVLIPRLEALLAQFATLNLLFFMDDDFSGWELSAAWEDAAFGFAHRVDFEKIAVVGGPQWVTWTVKCAAFLIRSEVRTYPADQLAEAWKWLKTQ